MESTSYINKNSLSIGVFKKRLDLASPRAPEYFNIGNRKENIFLCQLRCEASNLNHHLQLHHLTDNPNCPHCGDILEDNFHFIIFCPYYELQRRSLRDVCVELQVDFNLQNILFGNELLTFNNNAKIMLTVQNFIKSTKRFQ